jgi:hypothetical protein
MYKFLDNNGMPLQEKPVSLVLKARLPSLDASAHSAQRQRVTSYYSSEVSMRSLSAMTLDSVVGSMPSYDGACFCGGRWFVLG